MTTSVDQDYLGHTLAEFVHALSESHSSRQSAPALRHRGARTKEAARCRDTLSSLASNDFLSNYLMPIHRDSRRSRPICSTAPLSRCSVSSGANVWERDK